MNTSYIALIIFALLWWIVSLGMIGDIKYNLSPNWSTKSAKWFYILNSWWIVPIFAILLCAFAICALTIDTISESLNKL